jgi:hypothetical protein
MKYGSDLIVKFANYIRLHIDLHLVVITLMVLIMVFCGAESVRHSYGKCAFVGAFVFLQLVLIGHWFVGRKTRPSGSASYLAVNGLMMVGSLSLCWAVKIGIEALTHFATGVPSR